MGGCAGHSHDHEHNATTFSLHPYIDHDHSYCLNESIPNTGVRTLRPHSERILPEEVVGLETTAARETVTSDPHDPDDVEEVELLLHVKFDEAVNMTSMSVCGRASLAEVGNGGDGNDGITRRTAAPWKCKVFANRTDLDFDMARELKGDVELELQPPEHTVELATELTAADTNAGGSLEGDLIRATLDYPIRGNKFQYCDNVTLYFGENYSSVLLENDEVVPTEISYVGFKGMGTNVKRQAVKAVYESRGMKKDHKVPDGEFGAKHSM